MGKEKARAEKQKESEKGKMSEAEFCCDEGRWLADKEQYERERKARSCDNRIANQREEIRRLHNHIRNLEQSRDAWKAKAERLGKQLNELLKERSDAE